MKIAEAEQTVVDAQTALDNATALLGEKQTVLEQATAEFNNATTVKNSCDATVTENEQRVAAANAELEEAQANSDKLDADLATCK